MSIFEALGKFWQVIQLFESTFQWTSRHFSCSWNAVRPLMYLMLLKFRFRKIVIPLI